jgi:hypothetical protein
MAGMGMNIPLPVPSPCEGRGEREFKDGDRKGTGRQGVGKAEVKWR